MVFLMLLGTLIRGHVPRGWRARRNRPTGVLLVALNMVLIVTGWALYYVASEEARPALSASHWGLGFVGGAIFGMHALVKRRATTGYGAERRTL